MEETLEAQGCTSRATGPKADIKIPLPSSIFLANVVGWIAGGGRLIISRTGGIAMVACVRSLVLALAALLASTQMAAAQNIAETAKRWGLLGTWALDCAKPASRSNGYLSYVTRAPGKLSHERNFGDASDVNEVQQARTGVGGRLELVVNFPGLSQTRRYTLMMGADGRTKAMANSKADGTEPTIKDGKFTSNGNDTPWQVRCR